MVALFIHLKAAFDTMDRRVLLDGMRKKGIRKGLIGRMEEAL